MQVMLFFFHIFLSILFNEPIDPYTSFLFVFLSNKCVWRDCRVFPPLKIIIFVHFLSIISYCNLTRWWCPWCRNHLYHWKFLNPFVIYLVCYPSPKTKTQSFTFSLISGRNYPHAPSVSVVYLVIIPHMIGCSWVTNMNTFLRII